MVVFLNGKFLPEKMAKVSVFDNGFLYGDGVYETLRTYNGEIWQLKAHLRRLQNSAKLLGLKLPWPLARVEQWVKKTVLLNKFKESRVRITMTRGINNFDFSSCKKPALCIYVKKLAPEPKNVYSRGVRVVTLRQERVLPQAKSISLLPMILGQRLMRENKSYEAVFIDGKGFVREGTATNVFIVKNGTVITPRTKILHGVTCRLLLEIAENLHIPAVREDFAVLDFYKADEVFLTNAVRGVVPVVKVDRHIIGNGLPGSVTKKLMKTFYDYVQEKTLGHGYFKHHT